VILYPIGRDPPLFYVDLTSSYSNLTDDSLTLCTMDVGTNFSTGVVAYAEPPPTPTAKQRTRAFTDELNERDRKRRWRKG
jgi:hypothetical protein